MIVILDNIRSAYNVGSILRTCDGAGVREVIICGITDAESEKVEKTALGAEEHIQIKYFHSLKEYINSIELKHYTIIGVEEHGKAVDIFDFCKDVRIVQNKLVLVLGNEVSGISQTNLDLCDHVVKIPMLGIKNSLNVSNAGAIAIYLIKFLIENK